MSLSERQLAAFADKHAWQIPFDISPRHLAGPGDVRHVTHGLAAAGWSTDSDPLSAEIVLRSPDRRHRLQFDPQSTTSAWWRLRTDPTETETGWYAEFGELVPAEILTGFTDALICPPPQLPDPWQAVTSAGWHRDSDSTAYSPDSMCHIELRPLSEFHDRPSWRVVPREPGPGRFSRPRIWHAYFDERTPAHLVGSFLTALVDRSPLQRAMYDRIGHHSAVQKPSPLGPQQVVSAHTARIESLRARARRPPAADETRTNLGDEPGRPADHPPLTSERTLPISFDHLAHRDFLRHLDDYLSDSKKILDAWDAYSDEHTDLDGWPYDDHAYGRRASQRDADTLTAFEPLRPGARHLLATAETQLAQLPENTVQSRWVYQLGVLRDALDRLDNLHEQWLQTRDALPATAKPGTPAFDDALAEHHAESWSNLDAWATHGKALREINSAARKAPSPLAPRPVLALLRRTAARK